MAHVGVAKDRVGSSGHGNKLFYRVKDKVFLGYLSDSHFVRKVSALCS
jgi:hypothetical protein